LNRTGVKLDQLSHQSETDAEPAMTTAVAAVSLPKHFENIGQKGSINALAGIVHD